MGSSAQPSRAAREQASDPESELAKVQVQIRAHRESLATLHADSERDESRYTALKAEHEQMAVDLDNLRQALSEGTRQRAALVTALDELLITKTRLETQRDQRETERAPLAAVDLPQGLSATDDLDIEVDAPAPAKGRRFDDNLELDMDAVEGNAGDARAPMAAPHNVRRAAPPRAAPPPVAAKAKPPAAPPPAASPAPKQVAPAPAPLQAAPAAAAPAKTPALKVAPQRAQMRADEPRIPLCVDVDLRSENNLYVGFSENVSEGGLFVATYTPSPVGEHLQVQFTLPNQNRPITCNVIVAWHLEARDVMAHDKERVPGMGLHFVDLTADDRAMLLDFITQREPMFFPG